MEIVDKNGYIITLKNIPLYVPSIQCRLFIPYSYIKQYNYYSNVVMQNHNGMVFQLGKNKQVMLPYDTTTQLPIPKAYKYSTKLYGCFDLGAWTTDE